MSGCTSSGSAENGRPRFRVAEVLRQHGPALLARGGLSTQQRKALRDAQRCRTAALGGHIDACSACGHQQPSYNSCRNRHCPSCQGQRQQQWVQARMERVLPVRHFHVVFTVPAQLRGLWQCNPERLHALLFEAARVTLTTLAKQRLGAVLGVTAVLHTWTRELHYHPHLHCVVTAGGLDLRRKRWVPTHPRYLFPVALLGKLFRGVLLRRLEAAFANGELRCVGRATGLADPGAKDRLLRQLRRIKWVGRDQRPPPVGRRGRVDLHRYPQRRLRLDDLGAVCRAVAAARAAARAAQDPPFRAVRADARQPRVAAGGAVVGAEDRRRHGG